jgi:hypothetical protein
MVVYTAGVLAVSATDAHGETIAKHAMAMMNIRVIVVSVTVDG